MLSSSPNRGPLALALALAPAFTQALFSAGGLTILSDNELDGAQNDGKTAAILVTQPKFYTEAVSACDQLGEYLWDPDTQDFTAGLNSSLSYQVYQGLASPAQLYWVAKENENSAACRSLDVSGNPHEVSCLLALPTLCTQSATVSNASYDNNTATWQVTQSVAGTQFTGYRDYHTWKFLGVRFSEPTERFAYSSPYLQPGYVPAIEFAEPCVQPPSVGVAPDGGSEDCLYLNVWTPHLPPAEGASEQELKPVMVYYYGGAYQTGSTLNANTDGGNLASRGDVVVVTPAYRVGNVGWLPFKDGVHNGNYGVSDMISSLEWIQKYIKYFGGDASRVTVFGESAGAGMTHIALTSPKAAGLFNRAIMQSDPDGTVTNGTIQWTQYPSVDDAYSTTEQVLMEAGCANATDPIECLSHLTGEQLVTLATNDDIPVDDGTYIDGSQLIVNQTGIASDVYVMTGTNMNEAGVFVSSYPAPNDTFYSYMTEYVVDNGWGMTAEQAFPEIANMTVPTTPAGILNVTVRMVTDATFTCYDLAKAYSASRHGAFRETYGYLLNRSYSPDGYTTTWCSAPITPDYPYGDPNQNYYKCHGGEQLVMFGNEIRSGQPDRDGLDIPFMQLLVEYWASFGRTGNPNPDPAMLEVRGHYGTLAQMDATGPWEPVNPEDPQTRLLQWDGSQYAFPQSEFCDFMGVPLDSLEP